MSTSPRIVLAEPQGQVTRPPVAVPVIARLHWHRLGTTTVHALATAWTRDAVEITWVWQAGTQRSDWIPAVDVRRARPDAPTPPVDDPPGTRELVDLEVLRRGRAVSRLSAHVDLHDADELRRLLLDAVRRDGRQESDLGDYELRIQQAGTQITIMTFVATGR